MALISVTQSKVTTVDTIISYSVSGTALLAADYSALSGAVKISAGDNDADISIVALGDEVVEGNENVIVTLTAVTAGIAVLSTVVEERTAINTIIDDDTTTVSIVNVVDTQEVGTSGRFRVRLSKKSSVDTLLSYTVSGTATPGTDYTAPSGTLTIPAGDDTATITVTALDDIEIEGNESVVVTLTSVTSGLAMLGPATADNTAINIIIDDDMAVVSIANTTDAIESGTDGLFTVTLSLKSVSDTVISYAVSGTATPGTDYTSLPGTLTIPAGDDTATITVSALDDIEIEGNESVVVTLTSVTSGLAMLGPASADNTATNIIIDDDAVVTIENTADTEEAGAAGLVSVRLSKSNSTDVTLSYSVSGTATPGTDYAVLSGSVTIFAGDDTAIISVNAIDDTEIEGNESVLVTLTGVISGNAVLDTSISATNTIIDDDAEINAKVARAFKTQVHNYVSRRMSLQSRSSPSIHRRPIGSVSNKKKLNGNIDVSGSESEVSGSFSFSNSFDHRGSGCEVCDDPYFWIEAEFSYFRDRGFTDGANNSSGNYYIGYAGISLPVDEYLTIGIMGQVDRFEDILESGLGRTSGTGWAVGPYISTKVLHDLRLDIRGLWGASTNNTSQFVLARNFSGSFDTERWIVEAVLSGRHNIDEYSIIPSARIFYMNENWDDYTVSDGNRLVSVDGDSAEIGNLSAALEINKTVKNDDFVMETFLSGEVLWEFQDPGTISTGGTIEQSDDFSASISAGIGIINQSGSLRLEATYSGFGQGGLESIGGSLTLSHRF